MPKFKLTISRKILLLVGFVSLISGLAGILPLYLGSTVALERSFSNLLITSTQSDASLLNKHLSDLDSQFKLISENFLRQAAASIAAYDQAEQRKELSTFSPMALRATREFGGQYDALLAAAGERGLLSVANARGRISANSRNVFPFDLGGQTWWPALAALSPTSLYYAQVDGSAADGGVPVTYLLIIKPMWRPSAAVPSSPAPEETPLADLMHPGAIPPDAAPMDAEPAETAPAANPPDSSPIPDASPAPDTAVTPAPAPPPAAAPAGDGREFIGAVVLVFDSRELFQRAIGVNSLRQVNNVLVSGDGRVIYQPTAMPAGVAATVAGNLDKMRINLTGWFWADVPGSRVLLAHAAVNLLRLNARQGQATTEWIVVEYMDLSEPIAQNSYHLWRTIPLGMLLIGLLCLLGAAISYRIVKPLKNLQRGVERLRRGDLDHRVDVRTNDELEGLAESFNRMAQTLQETYDELEFKIRETDEKRNQLAIINEVIKATTQALEADRSFKIIAREVGRMVPYDRMSLSLVNMERGEIEFVFVIPEERTALPKGHTIPLKSSIISTAIASRRPVVTEIYMGSHDEFEDARALHESGARSLLVVPLTAQEGIIGSLNLASERSNQYGQREVDMILQVADTLAVSIEHANLYTRVARFAEELEAKVRQRTAALESAQQKLIQTEKFAATGRLAANIAHEINNPLGIIKNYLYLLSENVEHGVAQHDGEDDARENLRIIREEIDRIARIVRRLLDFYKRPETKPVPTDVNKELEEMFYLTRKGFKRKDIVVEKDLATDLPAILASPDKIRQVILNLLRNAEDAVSNNGRICITTGLESRLNDRTGQTGDYVTLMVRDNGCGISRDNLRQIFDPFFTTKQESGTGLGLSITYGIVESLGGWIEVESAEGEGSTFRVLLPVEPVEAPEMAQIGPRAGSEVETREDDGALKDEPEPELIQEQKHGQEEARESENVPASGGDDIWARDSENEKKRSHEREAELASPSAAPISMAAAAVSSAAAATDADELEITLGGIYSEDAPPKPPAPQAPVTAAEIPFDDAAAALLLFAEEAVASKPAPPAVPPKGMPNLPLRPSGSLAPAERLAVPHLPPAVAGEHRDSGELILQNEGASKALPISMPSAWPAILDSLECAVGGGPADSPASPEHAAVHRSASDALNSADVLFGQHGLLFLDYGAGWGGAAKVGPASKAGAPGRSGESIAPGGGRSLYDELFGETSVPPRIPAAPPGVTRP